MGRLDGIGLRGLRQREATHEVTGHALDALVAAFGLLLQLALRSPLMVSTPASAVISMSSGLTPGRSARTT